MSFFNCFAERFGISISKARKGHIEGSEAAAVEQRMVELSEQRALHGNHKRASPKPRAPLILSNSSHVSTAASSDFATKTGSRFDRMEVENNLDTFSIFQESLSTDACARESLLLPVPNRHSREQLRFWQAVDATSGMRRPSSFKF